ncbi:MAG: sigma-70 family RNA polymerase sigma factor [Armatimonadetes bacterium]|nr:sigma-70 family RNA polymerase sigma factor [Armatimonadota bacterium]
MVRRAQRGDVVAFDRLAHRCRPALRALAFLRTGDREEAEDVVQEVLTRAWQNLPALSDPGVFLPWLRAIAANACNSWHRRRHWPLSPLADTSPQAASTAPTPLEAVLTREKQRELRQALAALPEANRIALLMHTWEGSSYAEIAAFTGVAVTTVEGRIHRARRQLRRLLWDEGVTLLGMPDPSKRRRPTPRKYDERTIFMSRTETRKTVPADLAQPLALTLFSYQFSRLVASGVSLVRSLLVLEDAAPPYAEAARALRERIEQGDTLSHAMSERPDLFSKLHINLIRAGEVGGVLEETLSRLADLMTKEWRLARRRPGQEEPLFLNLPSSRPRPREWADFTPYQQTVTLLLFCETLADLLISGVPILQSLETVSHLLPPDKAPGVMQAREVIKTGEPIVSALERMGILPGFVLELISIGEEAGSLDRTLHQAADIFEHDLECQGLMD